ncbi:MAG: hypothetical protein NC299_15765 [Lachnospiraceae bacterium]|nr:hypothetical protein [Lachnospiraceae bacterium]
MYFKTISIGKQGSRNDLAKAFAAALAEELGWEQSSSTSDVQYVRKPNSEAYFAFCADGSVVWVVSDIGGIAAKSSSSIHNTVPWTSNNTYCLDIAFGKASVAVGIRKSDSALKLTTIIAENEKGEDKAIDYHSNSSSGAYPYDYYADGFVEGKEYRLTANRDADTGVSLVKAPDIYGGCVFKDLYIVCSTPFSGTNQTFCIDGKYYRYVSGDVKDGGFAIRVG